MNLPPWAIDVAVTSLLALSLLPDALFRSSHRVESTMLVAGLLLPLLWRRRYPMTVFATIAAVAALQWALNVNTLGDVTLLLAVYTVAATQSRRRLILVGVVTELGIALAVTQWNTDNWWLRLVFLNAMLAAAVELGFYVRTRQAYLTELRERADRLERESDHQGALAAAAERTRIAREMHDIVAHHLTVMVALSDGALAASATSPQAAAEAMAAVSATGRLALADTRRMLGVLRDDNEPDSLTPQPDLERLDALIDAVRAAGLPTSLVIDGKPPDLAKGIQLTVYRLVQEALTNCLKHAGPGAHAKVHLSFRGDDIGVEVDDDGTGAANGRLPELVGSHGLAGMRERVNAWGGELQAGPTWPQGWRIKAELKCSPLTLGSSTALAGSDGE